MFFSLNQQPKLSSILLNEYLFLNTRFVLKSIQLRLWYNYTMPFICIKQTIQRLFLTFMTGNFSKLPILWTHNNFDNDDQQVGDNGQYALLK